MYSLVFFLPHMAHGAGHLTPSLAGNANLKRQCYFLTFTQFFLLPEPPLLSRVPTFRLLCRQIDPALPHLISPCSLTIPLSALFIHIWNMPVCATATVFLCRIIMQYPLSDLPFRSAWPKAEIFCVYIHVRCCQSGCRVFIIL